VPSVLLYPLLLRVWHSRFVFLKCKMGGRAATLCSLSWISFSEYALGKIVWWSHRWVVDIWKTLIYKCNLYYVTWNCVTYLGRQFGGVGCYCSLLLTVKRRDLGENTSTSPDNFSVYLSKRKYFSMWKFITTWLILCIYSVLTLYFEQVGSIGLKMLYW